MKIQYCFEYLNAEDEMQRDIFTLDEIERGEALAYVNIMKRDGYTLVDRILVDEESIIWS